MNRVKKPENNAEKQGLAQRIAKIQQGKEDINALILEYVPFIKSSIYKTTGKHVSKESDEMSIGFMAFHEAIKSFDAQKGAFLSFANWVIKRRIIDYMRKNSKNLNETNFSDLSDAQLNQLNSSAKVDEYIDNPLKLEIDALSMRLKAYNIDFEELVLSSPKAQKTKEKCRTVINYIIDNPAILYTLRQKNRLPRQNF